VTQRVLEWAMAQLAVGHRVAIGTVIDVSGSVPGKRGARLAMAVTGARKGTVGGAGLEHDVEVKLQQLLDSAANGGQNAGGIVKNYTLHRDAKGDDSNPLNSLCGGRVTVAMEVLTPMPHILLVGGGHCSRAIADNASLLGWDWSVLDSRLEYSDESSWPNALERHNSSAEDFLASKSANLQRFSNILLLGHDWSFDQTLLLGLLEMRAEERKIEDSNAVTMQRPKIGVIGSKSKWNSFSKAAEAAGISRDNIESVTCPIGLSIGAESPSEIAIAVCAEIIQQMTSEKR
jgi:xanthine dehydrogenase accessory factor